MNRYTKRTGALEGVAWIVALLFMFPVFIMVNMAVRPVSDLSSPLRPTTSPTFENFSRAWTEAGLGGAIANSAIVTVVSVVLLVVCSALAAYPLARLTARWTPVAFYGFMLGLLIPFQLGMIPLYTQMRDAGLIGTLVPLIILYVGLRLPFSIFLYTQFLRDIPQDYEEAASLDGAGPLRSFVMVVFPLLKPITGTVIILNALFVWNDFLMPLLYLSGSGNQTVPVAIYSFVGEYTTEWPIVFAALIIGALPLLIVYFFLQRQMMQGLASGIKG